MTPSLPRRGALLLAATLGLASCGGAPDPFDREPNTSNLVVDGNRIPEVARVSVPMPPAIIEPVRTGSARASRRCAPVADDDRAAGSQRHQQRNAPA